MPINNPNKYPIENQNKGIKANYQKDIAMSFTRMFANKEVNEIVIIDNTNQKKKRNQKTPQNDDPRKPF